MRTFVIGNHKLEGGVAENGQLAKFEITKVDTENPQAYVDLATMTKSGNFLLLGDHTAQATVLKQISEKGAGVVLFSAHVNALPTSLGPQSFLKHIIEFIPSQRIVLVGTRELTLEEVSFLKQHNIRYFLMSTIASESMHTICDTIMEHASAWASTYVCVSLDVLDPAFVKVPRPSPGGMSTRELLYFMQRLRMLRNFLAAGVTDFEKSLPLAQKLLTELSVV